jgi:magnesium chelatase family protein
MFVLACNPCPCGEYHPTNRDNRCECLEVRRREYRRKISGPIADRIDITRHVEPLSRREQRDPFARSDSSQTVQQRVAAARERQARRYAGTGWRLNSAVPGPVLRDRWSLPGPAQLLVDDRVYAGTLTRRGATRVHRLAWTVADLLGVERPDVAEVETALRLRSGEPLLLTSFEAVSG